MTRRVRRALQPVKDRLFHHAAVAQVLEDDPLQQGRRDSAIPNAIRVHDDDRTARAHSQTRSLTPLNPVRTKQETLALQERRQQRIKFSPAAVRRAKTADADDHVAGIGIHDGCGRGHQVHE
jgi:hypothetical protein